MSLPPSHPAFAAHFTDPIYDDEGLESAPFGSDEGSDMLGEWGERRDELAPGSTVAELMETDAEDLADTVAGMAGIDHLDEAAIVRGAAFTLLRLVGHLDEVDRKTVLRVLDYEIETTGDPGWLPQDARDELLPPLHRQRDDLRTWRNPEQ